MSAPTQPAPAPSNDGGQDPFDFTQHIQEAPDTIRPFLEDTLGKITPTLRERFEEASKHPFVDYQDRLQPLVQPDEDGQVPLQGILDFVEMTDDPNRVEEFQQWWQQVGEALGFTGDHGTEPEGDGGGEGGQGQPSELQELREAVQALQQQLSHTTQQQEIDQTAQRLDRELTGLMDQRGVKDDDDGSVRQWIYRLALSYGQDPKALEHGLDDYLKLTGGAQQELLNGAGQETATYEPGGPSLGGGAPDMEPEMVKGFRDAKQIAMQRFKAAHPGF